MESKDILVTGGAGFMGSHLAEYLLNEGHKVTVLDNLVGGYEENVPKDTEFIKGDIVDKGLVDVIMKDKDIVYHLAAHAAVTQSLFRPIEYSQVDYVGSINLAVAAINNNVERFVFTSSADRYGVHEELPLHESLEKRPTDPYGLAKSMFEEILKIFNNTFGLEHVVLVPHNIYGPKQNLADPYRNVIAIFMNRIMKGKAPIIYGDGTQTREFSYIDDITPYIAKAGFAENVVGEVINIGPDENPITIKDLAYKVIKAMDYDGEPEYAEKRPEEIHHMYCSADKARKLLGYNTTTSLDEGLKKMVEWVKLHGHKEFKYVEKFEIDSHKIPKVWKEKLL